jgi:hypothetical protein
VQNQKIKIKRFMLRLVILRVALCGFKRNDVLLQGGIWIKNPQGNGDNL